MQGIETTTSVKVSDWFDLGEMVANADSEQQVRFLVGLARRFDSPWGSMQLEHIRQASYHMSGEHYVRNFAERLAEYFTPDGHVPRGHDDAGPQHNAVGVTALSLLNGDQDS